MFLLELVGDLVVELFDRSGSLYRAYKAAWRKRRTLGESGTELLRQELVARSVPGAYDSDDSPRVAPAIAAWKDGREPRSVRDELRSVSRASRRGR